MALVLRSAIADYLNIGTHGNPVWALCGVGFTEFNEVFNANVEAKLYVHQSEAYVNITRYEPQFDFSTDVWNDQEAIQLIYNIGRNRLTGENAMVQYLRTDIMVDQDGEPSTSLVEARLFDCACEVKEIQGNGGDILVITGTLHQSGPYTEGIFDLQNHLFIGKLVIDDLIGELSLDLDDGCLYNENPDDRFVMEVDERGNLIMTYTN